MPRFEPRSGNPRPRQPNPLPADPAALSRLGLRAFHAGNYPEAIRCWEKLLSAADDPATHHRLAEACFRCSFQAADTQARLDGLRRAVRHAPDEPRTLYHLALALHRANHQSEALEYYSQLAERGLARPGFGFQRGLAALELHPQAPLSALEWLTDEERESLAPLSALLSGRLAEVTAEHTGLWKSRFQGKAHANPDFHLWYGLAQLGLGRFEAARRALQLPPGAQLPAAAESARLYYHALALAGCGDLDGAIREWTRLLEQVPTGRVREQILAASRRQIRILLAQGRLGESAVALTRAIEALGESPALAELDLDIHERLAAEAERQERWEDAALGWRRMLQCLEINPFLGPRSPLLQNVALALEKCSKWAEAAQHWERLLAEMEPPPRPRKARGPAARQRSLPLPGAAEAAPAAGTLDPQEPKRSWIRRRIIQDYQQAGRAEEAIAWLRRELRERPNDAALRLELAEALQLSRHPGAGRGELKKILRDDPGNTEARLLLAEQNLESGRLEEAEKLLRSLLDQEPQNPRFRRGMAEVHRERGHRCLDAGQYDQAIHRFTAALELEPERRELQLDLAHAEYSAGDPHGAQARLEALLAGGRVEDFLLILAFWTTLGQPAEAKTLLERARRAGLEEAHFLIEAARLCLNAADPEDTDDDFFGTPPHFRQGRSKAARKEWKRFGEQLMGRAEKLGGQDPQVLEHLMDAYFSRHSPQAMAYLKRLLVLTPENPSLHVKHALMLSLEGRYPEAERALQLADRLARQRQDPDIPARIKEIRQSIEEMKQALQMTDLLDDLDFPGFPGFPGFPDFPDFPDRPFRKGFRSRGRK